MGGREVPAARLGGHSVDTNRGQGVRIYHVEGIGELRHLAFIVIISILMWWTPAEIPITS